MKSSTFFVWCLTFAVAPIMAADDVVPITAAAPRVARSTTGVHTPTVDTGRNQPVVRPNPNVRQSYPTFGKPIQRMPPAMNDDQRSARSYQGKQVPGQLQQPMNIQRSLRNYQGRELPEQLQQPMNVQRLPRNYQGKESPEQLRQQQKFGVTSGNLQKPSRNRYSYFDALKLCRHERHDRNWWEQRCRTIAFVNTGYYYLDAGYWYPAYGYDPANDYYDYDGPIYTYGDLLPDQVIVNVQKALQEAGYYDGPITGSLNSGTRAALGHFQRDYGLIITGAIDEPTIASLGLN